MRSRAAASLPLLIVAFIAVHVWLGVINLYWAPAGYSDVRGVYLSWMQHGFETGSWVGIQLPWVYPILALVPLVLAYLPGAALYPISWLVLVTALDLVALLVLVGWRAPRSLRAGWWWTGFLFLLGPIAVGRLDTISVAIAVISVVLLSRHPVVAVALLTVATWIKVWPVAMIGAVLLAVRGRLRTLLTGLVTSLVIVGVALALGSGTRVASFITAQTTRGLQIEAPVSVPWLWAAGSGASGSRVYFDTTLLTFQVTGPGTDVASATMTPLLLVAVALVVLLGVRAVRRGAEVSLLLPSLTIALISCLIVFNKVGSPQYITWFTAPLVLIVILGVEASHRLPLAVMVVTAALTQLIYPYLYFAILAENPAMLTVLTLRNLLVVALLGWAVRQLVRAGSTRASRYA